MPSFVFTDGYRLPANTGDVLWIGIDRYEIGADVIDALIPRETDADWRAFGMWVEIDRDIDNRPINESRHLTHPNQLIASPQPEAQPAPQPEAQPAPQPTQPRRGRHKLIAADHLPYTTPMTGRQAIEGVPDFFSRYPYEQRIAQSILMLAQKHALHTYLLNNRVDLGTPADTDVVYPFTQAEYDAARVRVATFAEVVGARVKVINDGYDVEHHLRELAKRLRKIVSPTLSHLRSATRNTNSYEQSTYLTSMTTRVEELMRSIITDACSFSGTGFLLAQYELEHGRLRTHNIDNVRVSAIRHIISDLLAYEDSDEIDELLRYHDFVICDDCMEWEHNDNTREPVYSSDNVCRTCIDHNYTYSDYHGNYVYNEDTRDALNRHGDEVTIHHDCDDFYFDDEEDTYIHRDYSPPSRVLRRYHTAKGNEAYRVIESSWSKQNHRFFGVELEVECRRGQPGEYADKLNDALNDGNVGARCFFEEDGSLSNGFEIITQPMGLDSHHEFWEWLADKSLTTNLRSHDTSTCGLHVHINRDNINKMQINKMSVFVHSPDNRNLIKAISRRYGVGYASMHEKKLGSAHNPSRGDPRYEAINLTNRRTIEIRIFKGSMKRESVLAAIEFTNALTKFTAPASPAGFVLTATKFMEFINHDIMKQDTRNLRKYLTDVGYTA